MSGLVLEPDTSTGLVRTTVHQQYDGKALGFYVFNNLVPIVLNIHRPGDRHQKAVLVFGDNYHRRTPFRDYGLEEKCCRKVYNFNIRHYVKCYLPAQIGVNGNPTVPYTYNFCRVCGASIVDSSGHTIQSIVKRVYRLNKYIWRPEKTLQNEAGQDNIFSFQRGNC